ncbi:2-aminomuconic semialdehyde dehydrogenase-like isoform X1 [Acropora millepora]|uniref:2-aminomuconic semialdehyde dehydrogenase-like isoform X1 n=2 Tax=Acropora millepora TaxID=45264 RepID=UPI001CF3E45D|nr:2-aminomuconic semialdehyde dehydrogenase-like isoform X1 [Acropora millepora]
MAHDMLVLDNFINGEFVPCGAHIDSYDPSTGNVYCKVPDSGKEEVDLAVKAAKEAFESWSVTTAEFRAEIMMKIADLIQSRLDEFAEAESKDQGKPVLLAKTVDIPRACVNFRFFASMIINASSLNHSNVLEKVGAVNYCIRCPVGVAGLISPWNLPIYLLTFKIAPAIAAGNTVVCKPSEMTSVTAWMMAKLLNEAGLPPGVCNLVFGRGPKAGSAIVQHPDVPLISFTGSTATGQAITQMSAPFFKKLSLELGGKNAAVIFDDADLEKCISTTVRSSFANQGEICLCTSRVYVQRSIYSAFLEKFIDKTRELKVGSPRDVATNIGALISKEHLAKVLGYVKLAVEEGGTIECGEGKDTPLDIPSPFAEGYFMQPTVITGLDDSTRCMQEEIFGPVVSIVPFDCEEEVIKRANGVKYGLAAVVWSENLSRAHRVSQKLQAGTVWCNCWLVRDLNMPFGGFKASGIGRDGAKDSYEFYTEAKTICIKM